MNKDALCRAFCAEVDIHPVPIGFAIKTPFTRPDGDYVAFFARRDSASGQMRLEDDGGTVAYLESSGVDLDLDSRRELFSSLLEEYRSYYDEDAVLIHSGLFNERDLPRAALSFSALMLRLNDLLFTTTKRIARSFKDDLRVLIDNTFADGFSIDSDVAVSSSMQDYITDFLVRAPGGRALAIFAGNNEPKALEAILFARELRERAVRDVQTMIVLERPKPQAIKDRTLSRVLNCNGLVTASFEHEQVSLAAKMRGMFGEGVPLQ